MSQFVNSCIEIGDNNKIPIIDLVKGPKDSKHNNLDYVSSAKSPPTNPYKKAKILEPSKNDASHGNDAKSDEAIEEVERKITEDDFFIL